MPFGNYQYTDDNGEVWAVSVPTDFAIALGMVPAVGQPYLDAIIAPRFANASTITGVVRSAVIPNLSQFDKLGPVPIVVGGIPYTWTSFFGEQRFKTQPLSIQPACIGPQGPPGPSYSPVPSFYAQSADHAISGLGGSAVLATASLGAGSYLFEFLMWCDLSSSSADFAMVCSDLAAPHTILNEQMFMNNISGARSQSRMAYYASANPISLEFKAVSLSGSQTLRTAASGGTDAPVGITAVKII